MPKPKTAYCHLCQKQKIKTQTCVRLPNHHIICDDCKKNEDLQVFRIGCSWNVVSHFEIPARTLEEAIEIAEDPDSPLPPDPDFVPGSFKVDPECCEVLEDEEI